MTDVPWRPEFQLVWPVQVYYLIIALPVKWLHSGQNICEQALVTLECFSIVFSPSISPEIPANLNHNLDRLFEPLKFMYNVCTSISRSCYLTVSLDCQCKYLVVSRKKDFFLRHGQDSNSWMFWPSKNRMSGVGDHHDGKKKRKKEKRAILESGSPYYVCHLKILSFIHQV